MVVGGATLALFSSKKQLKTGKQKLRLWRARQADGSVATTTPGKVIGFCIMSRSRIDLWTCVHVIWRLLYPRSYC